MTALDRALIKAYRAERSGPASADLVSGPSQWFELANQSTVPAAFNIHSSEPLLAGPHRRPVGRNTAEEESPPQLDHDPASGIMFRVDVGMEGVPAPALDAVFMAPLVPRPQVSHGAVKVAHQASGQLTVETVHLTSHPLSQGLPEANPLDASRPQLVVDYFAWPDLCEQLRSETAGSIAEFCRTFLTESFKSRQAIALVGTDIGVGCTTMLLCLARQLAAEGLRPAIVDANAARPNLADRLLVKVNDGWNSAITGAVPLSEVLIESLEDNIVLAPLNASASAEALGASTPTASHVWRTLRESHDLLLIDAGTVDDEASLNSLKSLCDVVPIEGVYAVCDMRSTRPHELSDFARRLKNADVKLLGMIENFIG